MGVYLNNTSSYEAYRKVKNSPYFVDKSHILTKIIPRIETSENCLCITRPRRFGKSVIANMMAAFFQRDVMQKNYLTVLRFHYVIITNLR